MRKLLSAFLILSLLLLSSAPLAAQQSSPPAAFPDLDAFIHQSLKDWNVPGLALVIVKDGAVIYSKGYGHRDVSKQLPVTPQTLFAIGSVTKSFTVTVLGTLADEKKLDWDTPVRTYLPTFQLFDVVATERATPRDLVVHRTGLPRHDLVWYGSSATRTQLFDRLRYLPPTRDFRSLWQYNNLMFMTAGILAAKIGGAEWEDLVRTRIFSPLNMSNSNFSVTTSQQSNDFALPYISIKNQPTLVPFRNIDAIGPAGSINSSVDDMSRYLILHMNKGKFGDKQILSTAQATQMQSPLMTIPAAPISNPEVTFISYGMALGPASYRGHTVVSHGGGIDGFTALLTFMPEQKIGMVILTNLGGQSLTNLLSYTIYDRLLGLSPIDWSARFKENQKRGEQLAADARKRDAVVRKEGTRPSHPLADFVGEYENPGYGAATISLKDDRLHFTFNNMSSNIEHFHYDVFAVPTVETFPFSEMKLTFSSDTKGNVASLSIPLQPGLPDILFSRKQPPAPPR